MKSFRFAAGVLVAAFGLTGQESSPVIRSTSQQVLLDMVVRDKRERFIRDLKVDDIQVTEDGVPQTVKSFRLVSGPEAAATVLTPGATAPRAAREPHAQKLSGLNVVSIVFERMSPKSRLYAQQAAQEFLKNQTGPDTYVGVFSLDYRLNALQGYTKDRALASKAVDRAATGNYTEFRRISDSILDNTLTFISADRGGAKFVQLTDPMRSPATALGGAESAVGAEGATALAYLEQRQLETVSYVSGWRSLESLLQMIKAQGLVPGRKTVLLLSEGVIVPPEARQMFDNVIGTANRINVSIYCIDVTGLTLAIPGRGPVDMMAGVAELSRMQPNLDAEGISPSVNRIAAGQDDQMLLALHGNLQENMAELAERTGGFLIANTNDLQKPLARIMEDVQTHYEVAYTPTSASYDGRFRKISVTIRRKDAHVQSRNGYYALPLLKGDVVQPFELPCLAVLEKGQVKDEIPLRMAALRFQPSPAGTLHEIVFEVPTLKLGLAQIQGAPKLRAHVSFLALIKDDHGEVVDKISRDLPIEIPLDKQEALLAGNINFHQVFRLRPGRYSVEGVVVDQEGNQAGVRKSVLTVPVTGQIALSNPMIARRVDVAKPDDDTSDPLIAPVGKITPEIENKIPAGKDVPVYFVVYTDRGAADKPQLLIELYQNGKLESRLTPELPAADQAGRIPVLTSLSPNEGVYELRIHVTQGSASDTQVLPLRIGG